MCSSGSLSIFQSISFLPEEYKVSVMPVSACAHAQMCVRVFTCMINVRGSVFDSVYMCAYVCMRFSVVVCKDASMCRVCMCVRVWVHIKAVLGFILL